MQQRRCSGAEDRKREEIIKEMQALGRVNWTKVVEQLKAAGFPERTTKSVRNRHLRLRMHLVRKPEQRNRCRVCGLLQRGHVCGGREIAAT